jgi:hypothetical protein
VPEKYASIQVFVANNSDCLLKIVDTLVSCNENTANNNVARNACVHKTDGPRHDMRGIAGW